ELDKLKPIFQQNIYRCFSFFTYNAQSINSYKKFEDFNAFINTYNGIFDFIITTETWYQSLQSVHNIPEYVSLSTVRRNKIGGGVTIYIRHNIEYEHIDRYTVNTDDYETVCVLSSNVLLLAVYRPPSGNHANFYNFLEEILIYSNKYNYKIVVTGDINVNFLNITDDTYPTQIE